MSLVILGGRLFDMAEMSAMFRDLSGKSRTSQGGTTSLESSSTIRCPLDDTNRWWSAARESSTSTAASQFCHSFWLLIHDQLRIAWCIKDLKPESSLLATQSLTANNSQDSPACAYLLLLPKLLAWPWLFQLFLSSAVSPNVASLLST